MKNKTFLLLALGCLAVLALVFAVESRLFQPASLVEASSSSADLSEDSPIALAQVSKSFAATVRPSAASNRSEIAKPEQKEEILAPTRLDEEPSVGHAVSTSREQAHNVAARSEEHANGGASGFSGAENLFARKAIEPNERNQGSSGYSGGGYREAATTSLGQQNTTRQESQTTQQAQSTTEQAEPTQQIQSVTDTNKLPNAFFAGTTNFSGRRIGPQSQLPIGSSPLLVDVGNESNNGEKSRVVAESDVWKISGDRLFYFNQYRGLQIIDVRNPDSALLTGTLSLPAAGEQMYLLDASHVALVTRKAYGFNGDEGEIIIVNVASGMPVIMTTLPVGGYILESRLVGTALYVATQAYREEGKDFTEFGTQVFSFDLSDPAAPITRDTLWFPGYGAVISATDRFLFVAVQNADGNVQTDVNCIDVTDPRGALKISGTVQIDGQIADKYKINLSGDVLTVISHYSDWTIGTSYTMLDTFSLADPSAPQQLGTLSLADGEQLYATRFDSNRVYIVTFEQIDPLWIVDLSDPANPQIEGKLVVPGWSTYIHPLGDRLVTIGQSAIDDPRSSVSLFDVSDPANPSLLSKVALGENYSWSEAVTDDKAFSVLPDDGLILVPFQSDTTNGYVSRVQLIDLGESSLKLRGVIDHDLQPRRATTHRGRIVSVSGSEFLSVEAEDRDHPVVRRILPLAWSVDRLFVYGNFLLEMGAESFNSAVPAIRIASVTAADQVFTQWVLTNLPVLGATVRSNFLYVLQGQAAIIAEGDSTSEAKALLSVFDLSRLPELEITGQTETAMSGGFYNSTFKALWPKDRLLVWATVADNNWSWTWQRDLVGLPVTDPAGTPLDATIKTSLSQDIPTTVIDSGHPWFCIDSTPELLAFDVLDETAPVAIAKVTLPPGQFAADRIFTANGLVYLSHSIVSSDSNSEDTEDDTSETEVTEPGATTEDDVTVQIIDSKVAEQSWIQHSFLDVIDFADAANPLVRNPIEIPGNLAGISHGGNVIYTFSTVTTDETYVEQLDALAYDGTNVFMADSLPLSENSSHPVVTRGHSVFVGRAGSEVSTAAVETWTLDDSARFVQLDSANLASPADSLALFDDLLAVKNGTHLQLFNAADPASLTKIASGSAPGCIGCDLDFADGDKGRGLWIPQSSYGVWNLNVPLP